MRRASLHKYLYPWLEGNNVSCNGVSRCGVGRTDGRFVGSAVGSDVGSGVGIAVVGILVGSTVGVALGVAVGGTLGRAVGTTLGGVVGRVVGAAVGNALGCGVGKDGVGVGGKVGTFMQHPHEPAPQSSASNCPPTAMHDAFDE